MTLDFAREMVSKSVAAQKKILAALEARPEWGEVDVYSIPDTHKEDGEIHEISGNSIVVFGMKIPLKNSATGEVRPLEIKFGQYHINVKVDNKRYAFGISDPASAQKAIDIISSHIEKGRFIQAQPESVLKPSSGKKTSWRAAAAIVLKSAVGLVRKRNTPKLPLHTKTAEPFYKPRR